MATGRDLQRRFGQMKRMIETQAPKGVADIMLEETKDNFAKQQYGNDDRNERWRPRMGRVKGRMQVVERYLNYRKLDYSGKMRRGIKGKFGRGYAEITSPAPYSTDHNQGTDHGSGGNPARRPPKASRYLVMGSRQIHKRQFMGVGIRTHKRVVRLYERMIRGSF